MIISKLKYKERVSRYFGFEDRVLEERIFLQALSVACLSMVVIDINTAVQGLIFPLLVFDLVCTSVLFLFFWLAYYKKKFRQISMPFLVVILVLINLSWFLAGGYRGPIGLFLMLVLVISLVIFNSAQRYFFTVLVAVSAGLLYTIEFYNPDLAAAMPFKADILGQGIIMIVCIITSYVIVNNIKTGYDKDRVTVVEMNKLLSERKLEIEVKNKELENYADKLKSEVELQTAKLEKLNAELTEKNTSLEQFTYILAHNVRSPISQLKSLFELLPEDYSEDSMTREVLLRMKESTFKLEDVIIDLGKIVNIKKEAAELIETVSIRERLNIALNTLEDQIVESGAKINVSNVEDVTIPGVNAFVLSIFYNLISNAIKYASPERKPIINIIVHQNSTNVLIKVCDNGIGMDMEQVRDKIFQLYRRFNDEKPGKGIGLFLIKTQVNAMGGAISVESRVGEGATFTIVL